jgi:hypothetical protein
MMVCPGPSGRILRATSPSPGSLLLNFFRVKILALEKEVIDVNYSTLRAPRTVRRNLFAD